jgi:uncharacterized protein YjbI with pentapeptide repeats
MVYTEGRDIAVLLGGTAQINRWVNENPGRTLQLHRGRVSESDLSGALLIAADLSRAEFRDCKLAGAKFDRANLSGAHFIRCDLRNASFMRTALWSTEMQSCLLDQSNFRDSHRFSEISMLETCKVVDRNNDVFFDLKLCRFMDRVLSWSRIRTIGQLRLFVPSYVGLIMSIVVLCVFAYINGRIGTIREAITILTARGFVNPELAEKILDAITPLRPSWRHFAVLISATTLTTGATLYLFCPARVREFTLDQWKFLADRPAFEYAVQAWKYPVARIGCALAYGVGSAFALILLCDTLGHLMRLLLNGLE